MPSRGPQLLLAVGAHPHKSWGVAASLWGPDESRWQPPLCQKEAGPTLFLLPPCPSCCWQLPFCQEEAPTTLLFLPLSTGCCWQPPFCQEEAVTTHLPITPLLFFQFPFLLLERASHLGPRVWDWSFWLVGLKFSWLWEFRLRAEAL